MKFILVLFIFVSFQLFSQEWLRTGAGVNFNIVFSFGSHEKFFGANVHAYIGIPNAQITGGYSCKFMKKNVGSRCDFPEQKFSLGTTLRGGSQEFYSNIDFDAVLHHSKHPYSLAYSYYWYIDPVGTSQRSGAWNLGLKNIDVLFENDIFGGKGLDKYRTGALVFSWRDSVQKISLALKMWTGETKNSIWIKTPQPKQPSGYRDITNLPYGYLNHGIVFCSYHREFFSGQTIGAKIGFDSERARHIFQNRISHDLILMPKKVKRHTPHYPMLNEKGEIVFDAKSARKTIVYTQIYLGNTVY